jgi:hypothetical protein
MFFYREIIQTPNDIVTDGLILNLDAGKTTSYPGSGTSWTDLSGQNQNGTLNGTITFNSQKSGSLYFNSDDDYVSLGNNAILRNQVPLTIMGWAKIDNSSGNKTLYSAYANVSGGKLYNMVRIDGQKLYYYASTSDGGVQFQGSFTVPVGVWQFFTIVVTGTISSPTVKIYLNSLSETYSYSAFVSNPDPTVDFRIGGNQVYGHERWSGDIGKVAVYNRALSDSEIAQNYDIFLKRYYPGYNPNNLIIEQLIANLDAGDVNSYPGSGTAWYDLSNNGNDGTLVNSPTFNSSNSGFLTFNGSSNYVNLPTNFFNNNSGTPFSVSIWFKSNGGTGTIFGQQSNAGYVPAIYIDSLNKLRTQCFWGGALLPSTSTINVNDNNWHNVTVTYNGPNHLTYIDGVLDTSKTVTQTSYGSTYTYSLGYGPAFAWPNANSDYFNGSISNFMFYNKALSLSEVQQNFNNLRGRYNI